MCCKWGAVWLRKGKKDTRKWETEIIFFLWFVMKNVEVDEEDKQSTIKKGLKDTKKICIFFFFILVSLVCGFFDVVFMYNKLWL